LVFSESNSAAVNASRSCRKFHFTPSSAVRDSSGSRLAELTPLPARMMPWPPIGDRVERGADGEIHEPDSTGL
jgi:hypothetical protein